MSKWDGGTVAGNDRLRAPPVACIAATVVSFAAWHHIKHSLALLPRIRRSHEAMIGLILCDTYAPQKACPTTYAQGLCYAFDRGGSSTMHAPAETRGEVEVRGESPDGRL